MLTTRHGVRPLGTPDLDAFLALTSKDPVVNVFAEHRARTTNLEPRWLGGEMWGRFDGGDLVSACHVGANLVPIEATPDDARAFGERALARSRSVSTIVGRHEAVEVFWNTVAAQWDRPRGCAGSSRTSRSTTRHSSRGTPTYAGPPGRPRPALPGVRGDVHRGGRCLTRAGRRRGALPGAGAAADQPGLSFARFEGDRLVFKAEVACASPYAAQIQGVFVPPDLRGQGLAVTGMAAVVDLVRREIAPTVSLYVNDWNPRPAGPTSGSASRRRRGSRP